MASLQTAQSDQIGRRAVAPAALAWLVVPSLVALLGLALSVWVSLAVFEAIPHNEDELAFLFQAKVFAGGALRVPIPPQPDAFFAPFVVQLDGWRFAKYPPGFSLLLAPASALNLAWAVNPVLGAASLLLVSAIGRRFFGEFVALLSVLLAALSPFFLEYAGSLMSHTATLCVLLAGIWCYVTAWQQPSLRWAAAAGLLFGFAVLCRPVTAVGVAAPFALHAVAVVWRGRARDLTLPLLLGALPGSLALPTYNFALTGQLRVSLYDLWWPFDRYGFGEGIGTLGSHTPEMGLRYVWLNLHQVAPILLGWPLPGLAAFGLMVLEAGVVLWRLGPRRERGAALTLEVLLLAGVVALIALYVPYWAPHPRYYYESLGGVFLLSALGAGRLVDLAAQVKLGRVAASVALAGLMAYGAATTLPTYLTSLHGKNHFTRVRLDVVREAGLRNALVFVPPGDDWSDYGSVFPANSPWLDGEVVYAQYLSPEAADQLRAYFPGRGVYILQGSLLSSLP
jgi:4-amino-4-deoxy-L-arabinose transferase-like glycosyltransferase